MLHPSYSEIMEKINSEATDKSQMVESRYSIVMAAADRAKQIIDSNAIEEKIKKQYNNDPAKKPEVSSEEIDKLHIGKPLVADCEGKKPLSIAVDELYEGKVKIINGTDERGEE